MSEVLRKVQKLFVKEEAKVAAPKDEPKESAIKPNRIPAHEHKPPTREEIKEKHEAKRLVQRRPLGRKIKAGNV
jgi:hypothetical protein